MTEREWKDLLSAPTPAASVERAARARKTALRRLDEERISAPRRWLMWSVGAAAVSCGLFIMSRPVTQQPAPERLQVRWKLSDGTSVHWVFDEGFALKGSR